MKAALSFSVLLFAPGFSSKIEKKLDELKQYDTSLTYKTQEPTYKDDTHVDVYDYHPIEHENYKDGKSSHSKAKSINKSSHSKGSNHS